MTIKKPGTKKQKWLPGAKISLGGREYIVKKQEETAPKGEAKAWILVTPDGARTYRWRAFRGLTLISGQELIRPRVRTKKPPAAAAPVAIGGGGAGVHGSAILSAILEDIQAHPRDGVAEFLAKALTCLGVDAVSAPVVASMLLGSSPVVAGKASRRRAASGAMGTTPQQDIRP